MAAPAPAPRSASAPTSASASASASAGSSFSSGADVRRAKDPRAGELRTGLRTGLRSGLRSGPRRSRARPAWAAENRPRVTLRPTARGLALLVLGAVALLASRATGLAGLTILGAVALAAVALGLLLGLAAARPIRLTRHLDSAEIRPGDTVVTEVSVHPTGAPVLAPIGRAVLREQLPEVLGGSGDLPLRPVVRHALTPARRGTHGFGDADVLWNDPFGTVLVVHRLTAPAELTVLPADDPIDPALLTTIVARALRGDVRSTAHLHGGSLGVIPRPYVLGDDLRRIHWRASARTGDLMTREDETESHRSAAIVLDLDPLRGLRGTVTGDQLDAADRLVTTAAALADLLRHGGYDTLLLDSAGNRQAEIRSARDPGARTASDLAHRTALFALADAGLVPTPPAPAVVGLDGGGEKILVLLTAGTADAGGGLSATTRQVLRGAERMLPAATHRLAIVVAGRTATIREGDWHLSVITAETSAEDAWIGIAGPGRGPHAPDRDAPEERR